MALHQLKANEGARKLRTRVGRGIGSGLGKTSGRGILGQGSRSGGSVRPGFEGGQNPLYRRIPKRGFKNFTTLRYDVINIADLSQFKDGTEVNPTLLIEKGLVRSKALAIKVLGNGKIDKKLKVVAHHFSQSALKAITDAGGTTEVIK
jgi:large subunit ribosomal protein L15